MAQLTVVFQDKTILKDGKAMQFLDEDGDNTAGFDALVAQQGHTTFEALQWDGTQGDIEDGDYTTENDPCTAAVAQAYLDFFDTEYERRYQARKAEFLAMDAAEWGRTERDLKIAETDWWALPDSPTMTAEQTAYRQALRDLPTDTTNWNPTINWVDTDANKDLHYSELTGITWPTKP